MTAEKYLGLGFYGFLLLHVVALFIILPYLLVSRRRLRRLAPNIPTFPETGWTPLRDAWFVRGVLSLFMVSLLQFASLAFFLVSALYRSPDDISGLESLAMGIVWMLSLPSTVILSLVFYKLAKSLFKSAWAANNWPTGLHLVKRPALTVVRIMRGVLILFMAIHFAAMVYFIYFIAQISYYLFRL